MQCTSSDRIKILKTIYGYNPGYKNSVNIESCALSVTDCNFDREFTVDNECTGRNACLVTIRKSTVMNESSIFQQTCADFNYVQINYQCLPSKVFLHLSRKGFRLCKTYICVFFLRFTIQKCLRNEQSRVITCLFNDTEFSESHKCGNNV